MGYFSRWKSYSDAGSGRVAACHGTATWSWWCRRLRSLTELAGRVGQVAVWTAGRGGITAPQKQRHLLDTADGGSDGNRDGRQLDFAGHQSAPATSVLPGQRRARGLRIMKAPEQKNAGRGLPAARPGPAGPTPWRARRGREASALARNAWAGGGGGTRGARRGEAEAATTGAGFHVARFSRGWTIGGHGRCWRCFCCRRCPAGKLPAYGEVREQSAPVHCGGADVLERQQRKPVSLRRSSHQQRMTAIGLVCLGRARR